MSPISQPGQMQKKRRRLGLRRTKSGCLQCRQRRKKCQLEKPRCTGCVEREWECTYPATANSSPDPQHAVAVAANTRREDVDGGKITDGDDIALFRSDEDIFSGLLTEGSEIVRTKKKGTLECRRKKKCGFGRPSCAICIDREWTCEYTTTSVAPSSEIFDADSLLNLPESANNSINGTPLAIDSLAVLQFDLFDSQCLLTLSRSQKELVHHFAITMTALISYYRGERFCEKHMLSLLTTAPSSGPLVLSLCALASAHRAQVRGADDEHPEYYTRAMQQVSSSLIQSSTKCSHAELLASILVLVYYQIAKGGNPDTIASLLDGAYRTIMAMLPDAFATANVFTFSESTVFLLRVFQYFDVIFSLSTQFQLRDHSLRLHTFLATYSRFEAHSLMEIDPVIGLAAGLWPLIVQLCVVCNSCEFGANVTPEVQFQASLLGLELRAWKVPEQSWGWDLVQELAMQEAAKVYQLAAQIYLLRVVGLSDKDHIKSLVKDALECLGRVCTLDGNMAALLWPVSVVASECVDAADRVFMKAVFAKLGKRQGMKNVDRVMRGIESQWRGNSILELVMRG
ncbi:fungal-specific transcription factor domain-containing protein [Lipomyces orientalis]|uniref:Fungal-specific transcription factor domain-containing protein n=1 Tax=Lipomyces orientalis TaxID=1233043 RepID=A0ACC3TH27_9ASCO